MLVRPMDSKPAVPKRQLFKKPAWSNAESTNTKAETPDDLFRHTSHNYSDIVAAQNKRRERRQAKKVQKTAKDGVKAEINGSKRRRVSLDTDSEEGDSGIDSSVENEKMPLAKTNVKPEQPPGSRGQASKPRNAQSRSRSPEILAVPVRCTTPVKFQKSLVIDLEDGSSGPPPTNDIEIAAVKPRPKPQPDDEDLSDEDDEYTKELKRMARENAEKKKQGQRRDQGGSETPKAPGSLFQGDTERGRSVGPQRSPSKAADDEPKVDILVSSDLPNTRPVRITRLLSQNLAPVRKVWCQRNGMDEGTTKTIFLTWRGTRLFDVTTCKNMGIRPTTTDDFQIGADEESKAKPSQRIAMEAMTEEIFERKRRQRLETAVAEELEHDASEDELPVKEAPPLSKEIRLTLKSPGLEDLKTKVRPNTSVTKMMMVYKQQRGIADDKNVFFIFDGERLEPEMSIGECDVDDLDAIDVQIR